MERIDLRQVHGIEALSNSPMLVSVVIPFFNRERFLAEAVTSVIDQTWTMWEIVLVDDGSTDGGAQVAWRFTEEFPDQIFLFSHPENKNRGPGESRNLGLSRARGDGILFLDSDDVLCPEALSKLVGYLEANPQADAIAGTFENWTSWNLEKSSLEKDFVVDHGLTAGQVVAPPYLVKHNVKGGGRKPHLNAVLLRRELLNEIGGFRDNYRGSGEDQMFWAKVGFTAHVFVINDCLARYRQHNDSLCADVFRKRYDLGDWENYLNWLEAQRKTYASFDTELSVLIKKARRNLGFRRSFHFLLRLYRRHVPLFLRYRIRDFFLCASTRNLR